MPFRQEKSPGILHRDHLDLPASDTDLLERCGMSRRELSSTPSGLVPPIRAGKGVASAFSYGMDSRVQVSMTMINP
jgi:hypothetical protein